MKESQNLTKKKLRKKKKLEVSYGQQNRNYLLVFFS
jgi:hypothetical protein